MLKPYTRITEPLVWSEEEATEIFGEEETIEIEGEVVELPTAPRRLPLPLLITLGVGIFLFTLTIVLLLYPFLFGAATVIITPKEQDVTGQVSLTLSKDQMLPSVHTTMMIDGATTGQGYQSPTYARGLVTFYNAALVAQSIPAGTLLVGSDGIHIVTDSTAYVGAGDLSTNGRVSVSAHVTTIGSSGNIAAGDVSGPCCRENILAQSGAFTGGQDARSYQMVSQNDIDTLTKAAHERLQTQAIAQLHSSAGEEVTPPACQMRLTPSASVGTEAKTLTIQGLADCQAAAYTEKMLDTPFARLVQQQLGASYRSVGEIQAEDSQISEQGNTVLLSLTVKGKAQYIFKDQMAMKKLIAGKSRDQAILLLLHNQGIQQVSIQIANTWGTLPVSTRNITITTKG